MGPAQGHVSRSAVALLCAAALGLAGLPAMGQAPAAPAAAPAASATFSEQELDQMLAPIALYPDSLLSQILMASTYPADVKDAAAWVKANPNVKGEDAVKQVQTQPWEPAVQSLVAFPQVLAMMEAKPGDVQRMGDAFLADPGRVMDRVQFLRKKAQEAGNLKTNEQQKVSNTTTDNGQQVIVVEPAKPDTVYVPVYQPQVVYGSWPYPSYPPYYWPPPPAYYPGASFVAGVFWGAAVVGVSNALWGGFGWGHNDVDINVNRYNNVNINNKIDASKKNTFNHNSERRRDVPYADQKSREQFGRKGDGGAQQRESYRGKDGRDAQRAQANEALKSRGADPAAGRQQLATSERERANANQAVGQRDGGGAQRDHAGASNRDGGGARANTTGANHNALSSGSRDGGAARAESARGQSSRQSMGSHGGGGGARAGGGGGGGHRGGGGGGLRR